jgi:4'-phosphopantetheinyl transferase
VACVVGDHPCGIDIESPRKISEPLVRYAMNDEEQALILQSREPSRTFLRLWTQKEAVGKLLGTGIRDNVKDLLREASYHIETRETEQWVMSVAEFH